MHSARRDIITQAWNRTWFPETSPVRLAICRIVVVTAALVFFRPSLEPHLRLIELNENFIKPQAIMIVLSHILTLGVVRSPEFFVGLYWVTMISGFSTLIGFFTKTSALLFSLGNLFLIAHAYSYGTHHHPDAAMAIFLLLLAFSPSGSCLSIDSYLRRFRIGVKGASSWGIGARLHNAYWPLLLTQVLLSLIYLSAGLCKLHRGGLDWINGYTLQNHLLQDGVRWKIPLGLWLAGQHELCILLSIGVILFECFFFVAIFLKRITPVILIVGVGFHIGLIMTMSAPFFQLVTLYVVFIDFDAILNLVRSRFTHFWLLRRAEVLP
jgi:uncharacterized membrane protein YphA (DoxX/SURF4 family)